MIIPIFVFVISFLFIHLKVKCFKMIENRVLNNTASEVTCVALDCHTHFGILYRSM